MIDRYRVFYLAHPVAGDVPGNLARAKRWLPWLFRRAPTLVIVAPWILELETLPLRDTNPDERRLGLERNLAALQRCEGAILVGGRISAGMLVEARHAYARGLRVFDMTMLGDEPPDVATLDWLEWRPE